MRNVWHTVHYRIAGNFRGWKRSRISQYRRLPRKFYSRIFVVRMPIIPVNWQSAKVLFAKYSTLTNLRKFSPTKVSHYTVFLRHRQNRSLWDHNLPSIVHVQCTSLHIHVQLELCSAANGANTSWYRDTRERQCIGTPSTTAELPPWPSRLRTSLEHSVL